MLKLKKKPLLLYCSYIIHIKARAIGIFKLKHIERISVTINITNLAKAKAMIDLHSAVADWLKETREGNDYANKFVMVVERWEPIR